MLCDQDDVWLPNKIEMTLLRMQDLESINPEKPILVHTDLKVVDQKLDVIALSMFLYQGLQKN